MIAMQVLFSRYLGKLKQGLLSSDPIESWLKQPEAKRQEMQQTSMSRFDYKGFANGHVQLF